MKTIKLVLYIVPLCFFLAACSTKAELSSDIPVPQRAALKPVHVQEIFKDGVCPGGVNFFMSFEAFQNLNENIINTETYLKQLENLLNSLQ